MPFCPVALKLCLWIGLVFAYYPFETKAFQIARLVNCWLRGVSMTTPSLTLVLTVLLSFSVLFLTLISLLCSIGLGLYKPYPEERRWAPGNDSQGFQNWGRAGQCCRSPQASYGEKMPSDQCSCYCLSVRCFQEKPHRLPLETSAPFVRHLLQT